MCPHGTLRIMFLYKGQSVLTLARAISFKEKQSVYKATFVGCGGEVTFFYYFYMFMFSGLMHSTNFYTLKMVIVILLVWHLRHLS